VTDSGFRMKLLAGTGPEADFSSGNVVLDDEVAEWLGTRYTWVLSRARRAAPTHQRQLFLVTNEGVTRRVAVVDSGDDGVLIVLSA
jgi:hypothetical protein